MPLASLGSLLIVSVLSGYLADSRAEAILATFVIALFGGSAWLLGWWHVSRASCTATTLPAILLFALIARALLIPITPATSGDVYRYLWEGLVQQAGSSPFIAPPNDPSLASLAAAHPTLHSLVTFPHVSAIYPPTAQLAFWLNALIADGSLLGWRIILLGFEALLIGSVASLIAKPRQRAVAVLLLAWCPLVLIEVYESAHLDLIGVSCLVAAWACVARRQPLAAGVLLGLAFNTKYLWPLLVGVFLLRELPSAAARVRCAITGAATAALLWLPYADGLSGALNVAEKYTREWHFNNPLYEALRELPYPAAWSGRMVELAPAAIVAAIIFTLGLSLFLVRRRASIADAWLMIGTTLVLIPATFPWYSLWLLPALIVRPGPWVIWAILTAPALHYVDYVEASTGLWVEQPWLYKLVTGPLVILLVFAWVRRLLGGPRSTNVAPDAFQPSDSSAAPALNRQLSTSEARASQLKTTQAGSADA